ncbi:Mur ligase family protein [Pseudokineococcus marinus]|uniref:UDP-N-acetylmuramoyl-tripeptide--D-alanyl-D-alanine ligase n=1 Tax=Pseudokineococcus marinus TaxID=351215 RepID=A0A849BLC9_9ACTN|nr:Mur ligase family protein [Pseudokineococcus marinus]NNH24000.1 UDP-N-acetylmuramoyl-tripeptide--D-alanyl-D-alanine ligase [Pseudokineococcus marinus]
MIPLSPQRLAEVVGGELRLPAHGPEGASADGWPDVSAPAATDSRSVEPGGLFVARAGESADGHDFVVAAVAAGAAASLVARPVTDPGAGSDGDLAGPQVVVPDVQAAFEALARHHVDALRAEGAVVVGITGSAGKTSTKDLLAVLLAELGPTTATPMSYNGEVGLPLTVLAAPPGTRHLVLEMGARGVGHVAALCRVAPPDVAVVLNVGSAHVGEFGSVDAIERAKGELPEALGEGGAAVLNADDERVARMAARTRGRVLAVRAAGSGEGAAVWAQDVDLDAGGRAVFRLLSRLDPGTGARTGARTGAGPGDDAPREARVALRLVGEHHVANAVAAAAVALHLGLPLERVAAVLSSAVPASRARMEVTERADGVTVVNDAYNANPESVRAALKALVAMRRGPDGRERRTWAVLGEMLELGASSTAEHDLVGRLAVRLNVSHLVAVGPGARAVHSGAQHEGSWGDEAVHVADVDEALALLRAELRPGDVVLVKSSNAAGLRALGDQLVADAPPTDDPPSDASSAGGATAGPAARGEGGAAC